MFERLYVMPALFELGIQPVELVIPLDLLVRLLPPLGPQLLSKRLQTGPDGFLDPLSDDVDRGQVGRGHVDVDVEIDIVLLLYRTRVQANDGLAMRVFADERIDIVHPTGHGDLLFAQLSRLFVQLDRELPDGFAQGRSFAIHPGHFVRGQVLLGDLSLELGLVLLQTLYLGLYRGA